MRTLWLIFWMVFSLVFSWGLELAAAQQSQAPVRIVLDPGHGGRDRGVSGAQGILEKDVVIVLARELRDEARNMGGFQVLLTREEDESFPWSRRLDAAQGADLWLSIHVNADFQGKAHGPRVFYSMPKEHLPMQKAKGSSGNGEGVRAILQDMLATKKTNESILLAEHLQRVLEAAWGVGSRPSRQAPLLGLPDLECAAVLVEVGFLTHAGDLKVLQDQTKRRALVRSILKGVRGFLQDPRRAE
jgi:N-acetylmuramoyl-L-alanine amidase